MNFYENNYLNITYLDLPQGNKGEKVERKNIPNLPMEKEKNSANDKIKNKKAEFHENLKFASENLKITTDSYNHSDETQKQAFEAYKAATQAFKLAGQLLKNAQEVYRQAAEACYYKPELDHNLMRPNKEKEKEKIIDYNTYERSTSNYGSQNAQNAEKESVQNDMDEETYINSLTKNISTIMNNKKGVPLEILYPKKTPYRKLGEKIKARNPLLKFFHKLTPRDLEGIVDYKNKLKIGPEMAHEIHFRISEFYTHHGEGYLTVNRFLKLTKKPFYIDLNKSFYYRMLNLLIDKYGERTQRELMDQIEQMEEFEQMGDQMGQVEEYDEEMEDNDDNMMGYKMEG